MLKRLQLYLLQEFKRRQSRKNPEQFLLELMDTRCSWHYDELMRAARLPLLTFPSLLHDLEAKGRIQSWEVSNKSGRATCYKLTLKGLQCARHTLPRS